MKLEEIKTLKDLEQAYMDREFMNIPVHCRPQKRFYDNSANELTKTVLAYFKIAGWKAWRQASEGRYIQGKEYTDVLGHRKQLKGQWIPRSNSAKGIGDICALLPGGKFLTIEIKFGKDRQSSVQKEFQNEITEAGGLYIIVKTFDDFIFQVSKLTGPTST